MYKSSREQFSQLITTEMLASIRTRKYIVDKINANSRSWSWQMIFRQSNRNVFYQMLLTSFMCVLVIGLFDSKLKGQQGSNQFESDYRISEKVFHLLYFNQLKDNDVGQILFNQLNALEHLNVTC